ncbi:unnamed protein product [Cylicocyclus nassatus]|uniref:Uncharacterized protein n=1 Tax=Cylicocyclus nassatus TaxID=53992 RepID=A0AA36DKW1_CYLNA|nr:unnamed protein product [Cylicocyclus nassatus]
MSAAVKSFIIQEAARMSTNDGVELTCVEEPRISWGTPTSIIPQRSCHLYSGAKSIETSTYQASPSIQDHLPFFAGENAKVQEVNINCSPAGAPNKSCNYIVNTKWVADDDQAAARWEQLKTESSVPRENSHSSYIESLWGNISSALEDSEQSGEDPGMYNEYPNEDTSRISAGTATTSQLMPSSVETSHRGGRLSASDFTMSQYTTSSAYTAPGMAAPWQDAVEMLLIRIIILEKAQSGIIRRQLDFEAPSDRSIASIYKVLEDKLGTLQKVQVYYTNSHIKHRTDLTKLPAGDPRQLRDLARSKSLVIFVVATDGVRVF